MKFKFSPVLFILVLLFSCYSEPIVIEKNKAPINNEENLNYRTIKELPSWVFDCTPLNGQPRLVVFMDRMGDKKERSFWPTSWLP